MAAPALARVQRWMQAVVVHAGTVDDGLRSRRARREVARVGDVLLPSPRLTAAQRIGIYHGMYLLRMAEALETDYPHLRRAVGEDGFRALARDFVRAHPSRSYTLNRLGDRLPEFIRASRRPHRGFLHDLARVERAATEVFDEEETAPLTSDAVAAVPAAGWERARLRPIAALRLLALRYPVDAYLRRRRGRRVPPPPRPAASFVALYRRDDAVRRLPLTRPAFLLLEDLAAGRPLGEAVSRVLRGRAAKADGLFRLFRGWMAAGLFRSIAPARGGPGRTRTFD